ncbi:unnamed protein product [Peniophora sp. CBMAI 1063]|nr:unnamed protein product [Peniophora sp. CBMAI 1063]
MSQQHKALLIHAKGARMELGTRPTPTPGAGQVLVRTIAVGLNPIDSYMQLVGFYITEDRLPVVPGCDGAGEVVKLGPDVHGWEIGDKVFYPGHMHNDRTTFQELVVVDSLRMAKIPTNITPEQAATIPLGAGLTPPWAEGGRGKYAGKAALVISGSGSVGQFALQLLKASGFSPLIATAAKQNEEYCKAAGATHVIDHKEVPYADLPAAVKKIVGETPIAFVYDAWAKGESQKAGFSLLAPGGAMATAMKAEVGLRAKDDELGRRVVSPYGGTNEENHLDFSAEMYAHLTEMLEKGELKPNNVKLLEGGFEAIPAGCDELLKGVSGVKLVARVD